MRQLRVAIVTSSYPRRDDDAAGHFVRSQALRLRAEADVHVVTPSAPGRALIRDDGIALWPCGGSSAFGSPGVMARIAAAPWRLTAVADFVWQARAQLAALRPDRVIAHWLLPCGYPISAGQRDVEVMVHGSDARLYARLPARWQLHIARALPAARVRVSAHALLPLLGPLAARAVVTAPDIDLPSDVGEVNEPPFALVVARLVRGKRVALAVEAAARADVPLVVIGDGPERASIARRRDNNTRLLGAVPRDQTLRYIKSATVLLHPAAADGAPTVVREARALGTPVISFGAGDARRWADDDDGITIVASLDAMATALSARYFARR